MAALARTLAEFVVSVPAGAIPALAMERAKMSLASTIASAAMGQDIPSARIVRGLELEEGGAGQASVWFQGARLPLTRAVRVNAVASDAAASDDSDMRSIAHIGTIVSSTALALGEHAGTGGADLLRAMVLGYEIAGRIDESLTPGRMQRGFHGSVSTVFGAAVTAGRLLGLDAHRMAHAISLAATSIGGMAIAADTSCAREYHAGNAAMAGVQAALAAMRGYEGEPAVLESPRGFLSAMNGQAVGDIAKDLGKEWDIVTDMAIKLMPGAHPFHATAEAAADAAMAGNVSPADIERVMVSAAVQWTSFKGEPHPRSLVDAAHSLFYFVAASIVERKFDWDAMTDAKMRDPVIAAVQDKIVFDPHPPPLPDRFPHRHGGSVAIRLKDGREFAATCRAPRGSGARGVDWKDVEAKYRRLAPMSGMGAARVQASLRLLRGFDELPDVRELTEMLAHPAGGPE
ncbi:MmgE/PrpD family protein [Parapusillimonas granuli]|uniref:MmgE/PrpD family protein n=1 Tax=Parapusillimonas granuli TaxID=380911 RepID=A0A853FZJ5_9BURK|nr:MmgE/PrpD family protein [Parapusillimonas granuli]MBB5214530.1 2-methylcitrate dehydratase PrpD [Parapusillimonas granuli]NYT49062.1 MmgE/PrpD family protein [Parapusillimonas granuli]